MNLITLYGKLMDRLRVRRRNYQLCFGSPAGKDVLKDLLPFCMIHRSCFNENERMEAMLLGRQQVAMRILQHLNLSSEELYRLYKGPNVEPDDITGELDG